MRSAGILILALLLSARVVDALTEEDDRSEEKFVFVRTKKYRSMYLRKKKHHLQM
jgi:hypothetical protein